MAHLRPSDSGNRIHETPWQHAVRVVGSTSASILYADRTAGEREEAGCPVTLDGAWDDREPEQLTDEASEGCQCAALCASDCACGYRTPGERLREGFGALVGSTDRNELTALAEHLRELARQSESGSGVTRHGLSSIHGSRLARAMAELLATAARP